LLLTVTGDPHDPIKNWISLDYEKGTAERAKDRVQTMADTATDKLKDIGESAQDIAGKVTEQAREYGEKAQAAAKEFKPFVEKSMKDQPMATLAAAAVIGFVLGALWKK
jgi:ElaB/YqjD/DUF883 family membrane-anchored ribosome-binding protein